MVNEFSSAGPEIDRGLPEFTAGVRYTLVATAWKDEEKGYENKVVFHLATKKDPALEANLSEIETILDDEEDPTRHLLRGNLLLGSGFFAEAATEFREYARGGGEQDLAVTQLRTTTGGCPYKNLYFRGLKTT